MRVQLIRSSLLRKELQLGHLRALLIEPVDSGLPQIPGANSTGTKPEVSADAGCRSGKAFGRAGGLDVSSNSLSAKDSRTRA